jgi:hypothetical protein
VTSRHLLFVLVMSFATGAGCRTAPLAARDGGGVPGDSGPATGPDLARACGPTCAACAVGACCGKRCCAAGEWCDPATLTCRCGDHPACISGDVCTSGGGAEPLGNCGVFCCGVSTPCPI